MSLFEWDEKLETGIPSVDEQHRKLVELINQLFVALGEGKAEAIMGGVIEELLEYTRTHFIEEEELKRVARYPGYLEHKKNHDLFIAKVEGLKDKLLAGKTDISLEVINFLKDWLIDHIMGEDKLFARHYHSRTGT